MLRSRLLTRKAVTTRLGLRPMLFNHLSKSARSLSTQSNRTIIRADNVNFSYGGFDLSVPALNMQAKDRMMLLGRNGAGKSTFARLLMGELTPDNGVIQRTDNLTIGYLPQDLTEFGLQNNIDTVRDYLAMSMPELKTIAADLSETEVELADESDLATRQQLIELHRELNHEFNQAGGFRLTKVLNGLGLQALQHERDFDSLSGGEKCRVALAGFLLREPDLLILDEPTNHLDLSAQAWLENYLKSYRKALILITHDRKLIHTVGNIMAEVCHETGTLVFFKGSYTAYLKAKKVESDKRQNDYDIQQREIRKLKAELKQREARQSTKSSSQRKKTYNDINRINSMRLDLVRKQNALGPPPENLDGIKLPFDPLPFRDKQAVLNLRNITLNIAGRQILHNCSATAEVGDRIVITGANGVGKSTLLRIINRQLKPDRGEIDTDPNTVFGYCDQEQNDLLHEVSISQQFDNISQNETEITRLLVQVCLFEHEMLSRPVEGLSLGQQRKLQLAKVIMQRANILLLDEPTNHMDIFSCETLERALKKFPGVLIAVSHDRWFIDNVATKIWHLEAGELRVEDLCHNKKLSQFVN